MVTRNHLSLVVKNDGVVDMTPKAAPTGRYTHIVKVNRFDFAAAAAAKKLTGNAKKSADAERAITDTIQYLGWMSLKNDDHNGTDKDVKQATERRAAADRLIAHGTIVLIGTWSNGIAVGPGAGFSAATAEVEVAPVKTKKIRTPAAKPVVAIVTDVTPDPAYGERCEWRPVTYTGGEKCSMIAHYPEYRARTERELYDAERIAREEEKITGDYCEWSPDAMHGPAFVAKPRVRVPLATMQACSPRWVATIAPTSNPPGLKIDAYDTDRVALGMWQRHCQSQPAPIVPAPIYTPTVGDTIEICYQHERMTTDRVITVQRVAADGKTFRGYDRTYDRVRNYEMARVLAIRRIGGEGVEVAAG